MLAGIILSYIGPARRYVESWQLSRETSAEVKQLRGDNARLRVRADRLRSPRQIELEARQIGMARPGERVYRVRGLPPD